MFCKYFFIDLKEKEVGKNLTGQKEFVNKSLFLVVELKQSIPRLFHSPTQLKLSGRQFEVGDKANFVRNSRNGQIWSVKHEQIWQSTTALRC